MPSKLVSVVKTLAWLVIFAVGVVIVRFAGEVVYYLPGAAAKRISYALTGNEGGPVTSIFFYLVAAVFVLGVAGIAWAIIRLDKWREARQQKSEGR